MSTELEGTTPIDTNLEPVVAESEENDNPYAIFDLLIDGDDALQEFHNLTDEMLIIKERFEAIQTMLAIIDAMKFLSYKKANRPMFAPMWAGVYAHYTKVLSASRVSATEGMGHIDAYVKVIIPMLMKTEMPYADKILEINSFVEDLERTQESAKSFSSQFIAVQDALKSFSSQLAQFSKDVGDSVSDAANDALKKIKDLEKKLEDLQRRSKDFFPDLNPLSAGYTIGGAGMAGEIVTAYIATIPAKSSLAGAVSCLSGVSLAAPMMVLAVAGLTGYSIYKIIKATTAYEEMIETAEKLAKARMALDALLIEAAKAKALDLSVTLTIDKIGDLIPRIGHIIQVWNMVGKDAKTLIDFMEPFRDDPEKLQSELNDQLVIIQAAYAILRDLLELVASKVVPRRHGGNDHGESGTGGKPLDGGTGKPRRTGNPFNPFTWNSGSNRGTGGDPPKPPVYKIPPGHSQTPRINQFMERLDRLLSDINGLMTEIRSDLMQNPDPIIQTWFDGINNMIDAFVLTLTTPGRVITLQDIRHFLTGYRQIFQNASPNLLDFLSRMPTHWTLMNLLALNLLRDLVALNRRHPFRYDIPKKL